MNENIIGIIDRVTIDGAEIAVLNTPICFNVFVGRDRLIFGKIGSDTKGTALNVATGFLLGCGVGAVLSGQISGGLISNKLPQEDKIKLAQLTPQALLGLNSANFQILFNDIESVKIIRPNIFSSGKIQLTAPKRAAEVLGKVPSGIPFVRKPRSVFEICLSEKKCFEEYKALLFAVLPDKLEE